MTPLRIPQDLRRSTAVLVLLLSGPVWAHHLRGSDTARDALVVQRGPDGFSRGRCVASTLLDSAGRIALDVSGSPALLARGSARRGEYVSERMDLPFPAVEFLPSWNVEFDPFTEGFAVALRLRWAGESGDGAWSDWYSLPGDGTDDPTSPALHLKDAGAWVDEDYILANRRADALQWRIQLWRRAGIPDLNPSVPPPRVRLFTLAVSDPAPREQDIQAAADAPRETRRLAGIGPGKFPWRTQVMGTRIDGLICCPTSVNMALEYYGHPEPTLDTTQRCLDRRLKVYGLWPRATQVLSEAGLDAWVERFRSLEETRPYLEKQIPILISIKARRGELFSAAYQSTGGHILVLRGFDENGLALLSDPGTRRREKGSTAWTPDELETVWIDNGGVGMLAAPPSLGLPLPYASKSAPDAGQGHENPSRN